MQFSKLITILFLLSFFSCVQEKKIDPSLSDKEGSKGLHVHDELLELRASEGLVYYNNEPFTGFAVSLYGKEKRSTSIHFVKGIKNGYYQKWFEDGTLSFEAFYKDGKKEGVSKTWWRNKNIRSESNIKNGLAHGVQMQWYKSGAKFKKLNMEDGKEVGLQQSWRENGKLYNNYEAKNGRIFGLKRANLCYELEDEVVQYKD